MVWNAISRKSCENCENPVKSLRFTLSFTFFTVIQWADFGPRALCLTLLPQSLCGKISVLAALLAWNLTVKYCLEDFTQKCSLLYFLWLQQSQCSKPESLKDLSENLDKKLRLCLKRKSAFVLQVTIYLFALLMNHNHSKNRQSLTNSSSKVIENKLLIYTSGNFRKHKKVQNN